MVGVCCILMVSLLGANLMAQNPLIRDQFSADPTARVFGDRVYVYPSHDILATPGHGQEGWFCMEDYHVFSSMNLTEWKDHGVILSQYTVPWVDSSSYSMWAPDCVFKDGKYYFYFPAKKRQAEKGSSKADAAIQNGGVDFGIGVAISDKPYGPFKPLSQPIAGVHGIDPNVFIDRDGQAYLYWAEGDIFVAKLKPNMVELAGKPMIIQHLPANGLKEGPFMFERKGTYYLTFPHVADKTERLEYAVSDNPMGPFVLKGVIMEATPDCWTNHQSILPYHGQWYLFYHHNDYSPGFDKARSICADSLSFNEDGSIKEVHPTLRGVGITKAGSLIQVDRYSAISKSGAKISFLDTADTFKGWEVTLTRPQSFVQYNTVDFGQGIKNTIDNSKNGIQPKGKSSFSAKSQNHNKHGKSWQTLLARINTPAGGDLLIHLDNLNSVPIAKISCSKTNGWTVIKAQISRDIKGLHNIYVTKQGTGTIHLDWIKFE